MRLALATLPLFSLHPTTMNVFHSLRHSWRWRDFIRMGVGIEHRFERCGKWWNPHLECSRAFVNASVEESDSIAILGAGRLLDVDLRALLQRVKEIHLFDLDPTAVRRWKAIVPRECRGQVKFRIEDITSTLDVWTSKLKAVGGRGCAEALYQLTAPEPTWALEPFGGVISLNVLGQLPLYWRDRVLSWLRHEPSPEERNALDFSMGELQRAHLAALTTGLHQWSVTLTDVEYLYYQSDLGEWSVEPALFGDAERLWRGLCPPGSSDTWWWHLSPQFVESDVCGEIHRVEAVKHSRNAEANWVQRGGARPNTITSGMERG